VSGTRARWLVTIGAVGLLSLGSLAAVTLVQGRFGNSQHLVIANCGPTNPPGTVVNVTLADRGGTMMGGANPMMVSVNASPNTAGSGTVTFVATNVGALNHELLVLPAPADGIGTRTVGSDGKIDESSSLGEASTSCGEGAGQGITPGATSWITLQLAPGNYELLCDEPWHYANGMFTLFTVQ
jgi:uncharacterized cupredoxin-like copper-binding protein